MFKPAAAAGAGEDLGGSLPSTRASSSNSLVSSEDQQLAAVGPRSPPRAVSAASGSARRAALAATIVALLAWAWSRHMRRVSRRPAKYGPGRTAMLASAALVALGRWMGVTASSEVAERAPHVLAIQGRQVLACWHPHGLYVMAPFLFLSSGPRDRDSFTYGFFTAVADACFKLPVFREVLALVNARAADSRTVDSLLSRGSSVFVCPGGIHEQLMTDPEQERVFFPPNLGFVRQAIRHGVPLLPTYNFGENQLYAVPQWSRRLSWWLKDKFGIGLPLGIGRWGLPFLPLKQHLHIRVGSVVEVGAAECDPSDERVRGVFRRYCVELRRLFDAHKGTDLLPRVADRGLELVWRGHEDEDLSAKAMLSWSDRGASATMQSHVPQVLRSRL